MRVAVLLALMMVIPAQAMVTVGSCPDVFEGRVRAIIEEMGPETPFSTQRIIFDNEQTLKGVLGAQVQVEVLKNGPFNFEEDKEYRVQLRSGKLCAIEEI
jgi:hypothetical protein